jgi:hypothetical protein
MLNFMDAMKQEHCTKFGCRTVFITSNYNIQTCPADEWAIVAGERAYEKVGGRRVPNVQELLGSDQARQAGLQECEVFAVVLYTGPMVRSNVNKTRVRE